MLKPIITYTILILSSFSELNAQSSFLKNVVPKHFALQYAGGIGMVNAGIEYPFFQEKLNLSFLYGYIPESRGGKLNIISSKIRYSPFNIKLNNKLSLKPINPTFILSYTLGKNFHLLWPEGQYDRGYYWWSSAIRWHAGFSSEVNIKNFEKGMLDHISIYAEASAVDMYIYALAANPNYFSLYDILYIGLGIRLGIKSK